VDDGDVTVPVDDAHLERVARSRGSDVHHEAIADIPRVHGERPRMHGVSLAREAAVEDLLAELDG
jgi:hypothetical protein